MKFSGTHVAALPREKSIMVCRLCIGLSERHCPEIVVSMWGACACQKRENKMISPQNKYKNVRKDFCGKYKTLGDFKHKPVMFCDL